MKAVDLVARVLKEYDWRLKHIWDVRVHLDYDSFEDWQLATLANAIARISTRTAQEALEDLKSALHELENTGGRMMLIGEPCVCRGMREAIARGDVVAGIATNDDKSVPFVGVVNSQTIAPFQYCPWCGNAAIEIKEADDGTDNAS